MGIVPERETERNIKLIADYLKKDEKGRYLFSISELRKKYAREENGKLHPLSRTRIHQILNKYHVDEKRKSRGKRL